MKPHGGKLVVMVCALLWPAPAWGENARTNLSSGQISLYSVQLACPAAPRIGCGSAAKPILLNLEHNENVSEAWLSRSGTVLAVVWKEGVTQKRRLKAIASVIEGKTDEVKGAARKK